MARVALITHHDRPAAAELSSKAKEWLTARGHDPIVPEVDLSQRSERDAWLSGLGDIDLAVTFGGDGTLLSVMSTLVPLGIPVMGVNVGRLGYLTTVEPSDLETSLDRALAGLARIAERMTLDAVVIGPDGQILSSAVALNDAVVERVQSSTVVRLALDLDGEQFCEFAADGLIVATPTGSTAYNLSARGPLVAPEVDCLVITPVSPHALFDRSLVLAPHSEIAVRVLDGRDGELMVDGQSAAMLDVGSTVRITRGVAPARIVEPDERRFQHILARKFRWSDA